MGCCCKKKAEKNALLDEGEKISNQILEQSTNSIDAQMKDVKLKIKITLDSFEIIKLIGKGTYGKVLLVKFKSKEEYYAMKILNKKLLKLKKQETHTKSERDLMIKISSPFIVNIKFAFQDEINLYLVSEFMQGGELFFHLVQNKYLSEELTRFYATELVLAISHIHKEGAIYRDLKPENILLGKDGHIKLTDFGLCKIVKDNDKTYTLCGTIQYLAPEILMKKGYTKEVDWWSLGCVIYEMLEGRRPFGNPKGLVDISYYKKQIRFRHTQSEETKNLIKALLNINPIERLGYGKNGSEDVKNHPFFKGVDWEKTINKEIQAPFIPEISDNLDLKYFDKNFTQEVISLNSLKKAKTTKIKENKKNIDSNYPNFSYVDNNFQEDLLKNADSEE